MTELQSLLCRAPLAHLATSWVPLGEDHSSWSSSLGVTQLPGAVCICLDPDLRGAGGWGTGCLAGAKSANPSPQGPVSGLQGGIMSQDPCEQGLYLHFLTLTNARAGWEDRVFPVAGLLGERPGHPMEKARCTASSPWLDTHLCLQFCPDKCS